MPSDLEFLGFALVSLNSETFDINQNSLYVFKVFFRWLEINFSFPWSTLLFEECMVSFDPGSSIDFWAWLPMAMLETALVPLIQLKFPCWLVIVVESTHDYLFSQSSTDWACLIHSPVRQLKGLGEGLSWCFSTFFSIW